MKYKNTLTEVPETMLWTLHNRACEALHSQACIQDTKCIEIYRQIDCDYEKQFGKADGSHGVRSMLFDEQLKIFLAQHPDAVIINLGEGLETQRYRIDAPQALWFSIDLPDAIAVRERFITPDERHIHIAESALNQAWFDKIPQGRPVFITAQGLFMYFAAKDLAVFIRALAQRFPGARLMFDYINPALAKRTLSDKGWMKTKHYRTPPMPWGIQRNQIAPTFSGWIGQPVKVCNVPFLFPRGIFHYLIPLLEKCPPLANHLPGICYLDFPGAKNV